MVLGVRRIVRGNLPARGSGSGLKRWEYELRLVVVLWGGGRSMEDNRGVEWDEGLR